MKVNKLKQILFDSSMQQRELTTELKPISNHGGNNHNGRKPGSKNKLTLKSLDKKLDLSIKSLDKKLDLSIKSLDKKLDSSIESLNKKLDLSIKSLDKKLDSSIKSLDKKLDLSIKSLDSKLDKLANIVENLAKEMRDGFKQINARIDNLVLKNNLKE